MYQYHNILTLLCKPVNFTTHSFVFYINTTYYENASFLRVRNITLGYTLPKALTSKWSIDKLRFYVTANNPLIFTNFSGIDPEGATGNTSPSYSSWMFGLNLSL